MELHVTKHRGLIHLRARPTGNGGIGDYFETLAPGETSLFGHTYEELDRVVPTVLELPTPGK